MRVLQCTENNSLLQGSLILPYTAVAVLQSEVPQGAKCHPPTCANLSAGGVELLRTVDPVSLVHPFLGPHKQERKDRKHRTEASDGGPPESLHVFRAFMDSAVISGWKVAQEAKAAGSSEYLSSL